MAKLNQIREAAEADFITFISLVAPYIHFGDIHRELAAWLTRIEGKDNKLVLLPRGHAKALSLDSDILTPNGWVKLSDLKENDFVIGADGTSKKIIKLHPISEMDLYEVSTRDGRRVLCNKEHLWNVVIPSNTKDKIVTKSLEEIIPMYKSDRFDKRNNTSYVEHRVFIPSCDPIQFSDKEFKVDPYTLGVWLGDGTSRDSSISSADPEIFEYIPYNFWKCNQKYRWTVGGLKTKLRQYNLIANKHIPEEYLFGSISQRLCLLQGLMDTDGTIHKDGNIGYFSNKNEKIIDGVVSLVRSLGGTANKLNTISRCNGKEFKSFTVSVKLPKGFTPFKLKRKADKWVGSFDTKSAITNIEFKKKDLGRCITVEDETFITNDYLLTHNSKMVAFLAAWWITKNPTETILYVSATADLAEKQLYQIKQILESSIYRRYWPDMIHPDEGKRERWTVAEIMVDSPLRKQEGTRDPTVKAIGITGNTTGFHATKVILDDLVVPGNAYTEEGRSKVSQLYSQLASIEEPNAQEVVVGTRYHPQDLYNTLLTMKEIVYTPDGEEEDEVYEVFQRVVETDGEYLWPRSQRKDGKAFGFDDQVLARIKAKYVDQAQFYAQYYNEPNAAGDRAIDSTKFQYFDKKHLREEDGYWYFKDKRLALSAAIDFAFSLKRKADSTAIVVVGTDYENNHYVLDILRFKTEKISEYFKNILDMYHKWNVKKWRAEITVAQQAIVRELKDNYIKPQGVNISIDEYRPSRHEGDKQERIEAILSHRYENMQIWHYRGGNTQLLEEELVLRRPPHDDIKEALANAIAISTPGKRTYTHNTNVIQFKSRFGGI